MAALKALPLGEDGLRYILSSLNGAGRLADSLAAEIGTVRAAADNVFALLPPTATLARAKEFDTGESMQGGWAWFADRAAGLCKAYGCGTIFTIDTVTGPFDPGFVESAVDKFVYDGRVQFSLSCADLTAGSFDEFVRAVACFHYIAAFTTYPLSMGEVPTDHVVDDELVARLAAGVKAVFIGAYDRESFVVWTK